MQTCKITFSDIQPGFVHTALLDDTHHYPLQLNPTNVAKSIINTIVHKKTCCNRLEIFIGYCYMENDSKLYLGKTSNTKLKYATIMEPRTRQ